MRYCGGGRGGGYSGIIDHSDGISCRPRESGVFIHVLLGIFYFTRYWLIDEVKTSIHYVANICFYTRICDEFMMLDHCSPTRTMIIFLSGSWKVNYILDDWMKHPLLELSILYTCIWHNVTPLGFFIMDDYIEMIMYVTAFWDVGWLQSSSSSPLWLGTSSSLCNHYLYV